MLPSDNNFAQTSEKIWCLGIFIVQGSIIWTYIVLIFWKGFKTTMDDTVPVSSNLFPFLWECL
ncbi:MAG: hypothetical protein EAZ92_13550 [Candidatus Kapaibacterium sp.]|nr:MAG: hypothetical protein EAZ92_13550 [Candidatus Kapabacteria bacterium]